MEEERSLEELNSELALQTEELEGKYLTFWSDGQLFGIPIAYVMQIVGMQEITSVPGYPEYVKGVINMRGAVIPVIDFKMRLGAAQTSCDSRTCLIVINVDAGEEGLSYIVDGVEEVTAVADEQISAPPRMDGAGDRKFITGIARQDRGDGKAERMILCVDPLKVIGREELSKGK